MKFVTIVEYFDGNQNDFRVFGDFSDRTTGIVAERWLRENLKPSNIITRIACRVVETMPGTVVDEEPTPGDRIRMVAAQDRNGFSNDYSGRGMYGRTCLAIHTTNIFDTIAAVGLPGARTDEMGKSYVVYWPEVRS